MVKGTPPKSAAHVVVRSIAFTPGALGALEELAGKIGARLGRKTSVSAVVRAMLRHIQDDSAIGETLAALVDREQTTEVSWGKPRPK